MRFPYPSQVALTHTNSLLTTNHTRDFKIYFHTLQNYTHGLTSFSTKDHDSQERKFISESPWLRLEKGQSTDLRAVTVRDTRALGTYT